MRHPVLLGASVLSVLLVAVVVTEIAGFPAPADTQAAPRGHAAEASAGPGAAPDAGHRQAMVEAILRRPLFEPSRRPVPATTANAAPPALPRLAGIVFSPTGHSAIFASRDGGRPVVIAEGGTLGGFLIQSIAADQVVVVGRDGSRILHPSFDPAAKPSPSPQTRPAAAPLLAAPASVPVTTPARITLPGLSGRPLGLVGNGDVASGAASSDAGGFPSLAAPDPK